MQNRISLKTWLSIAGLILLFFCIWYFRTIVLYVVLAMVFAFIFGPVVDFLDGFRLGRFDLPRTLAVILVQISFLLLLVGFLYFFVPTLADQINNISRVDQKMIDASFARPIDDLQRTAAGFHLNITDQTGQEFQQDLMKFFSFARIRTLLSDVLGVISSFLGGLFSVLFISFFFLKDRFMLYRIIHVLTPDKHEPAMQRAVRGIRTMLTRYFRGILLQIFVYGFYIWAGLSIFGIEYAFTIAFFAGLFNLVPYVGPFIALGFGTLLGITSHLGFDFYDYLVPMMGKIALVFIIAIMLDNFVSYPMIFSSALKSHPLENFLVVLIAGSLGGIPAMLVAMPVYTVIRVIAKEFLTRFEIVRSLTKEL